MDAPRAVPSVLLRASIVLLTGVLAFLFAPTQVWSVVAVLLGVGAGVSPKWRTGWVAVAVLALTQLARDPEVGDWHPYVLLAGLHLLHVLCALSTVAPARGGVARGILTRSLRDYAIIQVPSQAILALALALMSVWMPPSVVPWLAAIAVLALIGIAIALLIPVRRHAEGRRIRR